jgi:uncharacterized iron-regulated membrane protein
MKRFLRKLHRWLGLLMALQIIAWMASGLYFSLFPIEEIRGEHLTRPAESLSIEDLQSLGAPAAVKDTLDGHIGPGWSLDALTPFRRDGEVFWRVSGTHEGNRFSRLISADGLRVAPPLDAAEAERRAIGWLRQPAKAESVSRITQPPENLEFRGRPLPAWRIDFRSPDGLSLYLDPWTGELLARRTDRWRLFDFLWMLHIMDFENRDDFNHVLLQLAAALGLIVALSGLVFWAVTSRWFRRRPAVSQ